MLLNLDTVIHFEKRLDKFWQNVEFKFDYKAFLPDRLQPAGIVSQPGSGHRGLQSSSNLPTNKKKKLRALQAHGF